MSNGLPTRVERGEAVQAQDYAGAKWALGLRFEAEDFGPPLTPELREQEERRRAQVAKKR